MEHQKIPKVRKSTDLTQKEIAMLRSTSKLSDKEIKLWHAEFIGKFPNGKLEKDAFLKAYKELNPGHDDATTTAALSSIDTDKDGTINFNEFLFFTAVNGQGGSLDERLDTIFDLWDVSNDGHLDQNELAHLISAMYDRVRTKDRQGDNNPTKRAKEIINKLDASGDRKLSKDEFVKGLKSDEAICKLLAPGH